MLTSLGLRHRRLAGVKQLRSLQKINHLDVNDLLRMFGLATSAAINGGRQTLQMLRFSNHHRQGPVLDTP